MRPLIPAVSAVQLVESAPEIEKTGVNIKVPFPACTQNSNRAIYDCAFLCHTAHCRFFQAPAQAENPVLFFFVFFISRVVPVTTRISGQHPRRRFPRLVSAALRQLVGASLNAVEDRSESET